MSDIKSDLCEFLIGIDIIIDYYYFCLTRKFNFRLDGIIFIKVDYFMISVN